MNTRRDAQDYVISCIEASGLAIAAEYDIDKIVSDLHFDLGSYQFVNGPADNIPGFWETVECYEL